MNVTEKRSSELLLRPRFSIDIDEHHEKLFARIKTYLQSDDCNCVSTIVDGHVFIDVPPNKNHFWSPQLQFEVLESDENTSVVKGLFGPKPQVWTLFMFVHFIVATMFLGFGVMAYVNYSLGESLFLPVSMLIVLPLVWMLLYFLGTVGKETGKKQMKELHDLLLQIIEN